MKKIQIIKSNFQLRYLRIFIWSIWEVKKEKNGNFYIQTPNNKQLTLIKSDECRVLTIE